MLWTYVGILTDSLSQLSLSLLFQDVDIGLNLTCVNVHLFQFFHDLGITFILQLDETTLSLSVPSLLLVALFDFSLRLRLSTIGSGGLHDISLSHLHFELLEKFFFVLI